MPEVSVVIVCMGGPRKHLEACLAGLRAHTSASYEVLVVAYRWEEADKEAFAKAHPEVTLIPSDEVRGFSENNNLALPLAKGRYCLVLNDDTRMEEPVVDKLLADWAGLPENAAVVSPCIRFADGRIQTCGRSRWTAWRYAKHYLHLVDEGNVGSPEDSVSLRSTPASSRINVADTSALGLPEAVIRVACSKGTYIRAFARDLGEALGSGAHLSDLIRSRSGAYRIEDALSLDQALALFA